MTHAEPLLQVRDLRVDVGERSVLKSVSLDVPAGALLVLMGANGSGKSTLGLTLAGHPRYRVSRRPGALWRPGPAGDERPSSARAPGCSCPSRRRPRSPV
jgi:ABC-type sugar transport system ATPase subunit